MPATPPPISDDERERLVQLGDSLRRTRKQQRVSAVAASEAAGISRVTLHRIERGESSVAIASWLAAATALGLTLDLRPAAASPAAPPPLERVRLEDFPQLRKLAWQLQGVDDLSPREALDLYERNWRHVDRAALSVKESALIDALSKALGGGRLLV